MIPDSAPGETVGVILLNLGGPDSLSAIRPFLYNLFSDRQIIRLGPAFLQRPLAKFISTMRSRKTREMYRLIGGKSPIREITEAQAKALEEALNKSTESGRQEKAPTYPTEGKHAGRRQRTFKVFVGMRYWHPFIEDVVPLIYNSGVRKLIALSLYPHYSIATSGSSLSKFEEVSASYKMDTIHIPSWHDHPLYIEAMTDLISKGIASFSGSSVVPLSSSDVHVLFSAHSLPKKIIDEGDPYVDHIMETISATTERLQLTWHLGYQSRSGPVEWLKPSTDDKIEELAQRGVRNILIVPISFVSDHIETLYEIDILYKGLAERLGVRLERTASLNTHPKFIEALRDLVERSLE